MQQTEFKTHKTIVSQIEEDIFLNHVIAHQTVELEDIYLVKEANMKLAKGNPYALLVSKGDFAAISPEVRKVISTQSFAKDTIAKALLISSVADKMIGQFYIKINKPAIKTKLFTREDKALAWLREQLDLHHETIAKKSVAIQ